MPKRSSLKSKDMIGMTFNRLTIIERIPNTSYGIHKFRCRCICGKYTVVCKYPLTSGGTKSCGCYSQEVTSKIMTKHGHSKGRKRTKEFDIWKAMIARCYKINNKSYLNYGGRGIKVCKRWHTFINFFSDMGNKPPLLTLERIDNNKGYNLSNCRWATRSEQCLNTRRTKWIKYNGELKPLMKWARELNLNYGALQSRLKRFNWSVRDTLSTPTITGFER